MELYYLIQERKSNNMKEKIQKMNLQKTFLAGMLILLAVYALLWFVQMMNVTIITKKEVLDSLMFADGIAQCKYNVPFPYGICSVLEWFLPLFLCLSYVAFYVGERKLHITLSGIAVAGFITTCFGSLGLKQYAVYGDSWGLLFSGNAPYWKGADPQIGVYLPMYYALWYLVAIVLMVCAPVILKWMKKSKKTTKVGLVLLYLIALSESILFNVVYFGQYTVFFVLRSILIFIPILFVLLRTDADVADETLQECICEEQNINLGEDFRIKKIFGIGIGVSILIYLLAGVFDVVSQMGRYPSFRAFVMIGLQFLFYNFSVFLAGAFSVYIVKNKKRKTTVGMMATLCGIAFYVQYVLLLIGRSTIVFGNQSAMVSWCIILYLLLTWLWKESKTINNVFLVVMYLIIISTTWIGRFYMQPIVAVVSYLYLFLYFVMFGITLYALRETKVTKEESVQDKKGIWLLLLAYALFSIFEYGIVYTICASQGKILIDGYGIPILGSILRFTEIYGTTVMYVFAFLIVVSYLAHAMNKKEMYLFCSLGAFTTMFFVESEKMYSIGEYKMQLGLSVTMMVMMILLFMLPILCKLFPKREKVLGKLFLIITYGVLFCHYVLPLTVCEIGRRDRVLIHILTQILLFGIAVVTFLMYRKKSKEAFTLKNT